MELVRKAQATTAHQIAGVLEQLAGNGEVMQVVNTFLPPAPDRKLPARSRRTVARDEDDFDRPW